jgi:hypothetical protein
MQADSQSCHCSRNFENRKSNSQSLTFSELWLHCSSWNWSSVSGIAISTRCECRNWSSVLKQLHQSRFFQGLQNLLPTNYLNWESYSIQGSQSDEVVEMGSEGTVGFYWEMSELEEWAWRRKRQVVQVVPFNLSFCNAIIWVAHIILSQSREKRAGKQREKKMRLLLFELKKKIEESSSRFDQLGNCFLGV